MAKPFVRSQAFTHWLVCVFVTLILPLAPLGIEAFAYKGHISLTSLMLAAGIYTISTGLISRDSLLASSSLVVAVIFIGMYGVVLARGGEMTYKSYFTSETYFSDVVILLAMICNALVKFKYHVIEVRPFDDFSVGKS